MSSFQVGNHIRFRTITSEGPMSGTGEVIKIFPTGQSHWIHVRQGDGNVRMLIEATTQIEILELETA